MCYYYTDVKCALDDIDNECIKISRLGEVNDPNEWRPIFSNCAGTVMVPEDYSHHFVVQHWGSKYGFVSLSKKWNIPPMWGHYADKYRGVVLEVECLHAENIIEVQYTDERPVCTIEASEDNLRKIVATKSSDWRYEQELRYLHSLNPEYCLYRNGCCFGPMKVASPFEAPAIRLSRVICGPEITQESYFKIRQMCLSYEPHCRIPVVRTVYEEKTYGLQIEGSDV